MTPLHVESRRSLDPLSPISPAASP
jgi:hypothetical protein